MRMSFISYFHMADLVRIVLHLNIIINMPCYTETVSQSRCYQWATKTRLRIVFYSNL